MEEIYSSDLSSGENQEYTLGFNDGLLMALSLHREMQMKRLPRDLKRYLALWLTPASFYALRNVDRAFSEALSNHEEYFRPRVKALSTFEPELQLKWISTYEQIFYYINDLLTYRGDFFLAIHSYDALVKLVLQTPRLLRKFLDVEKGHALRRILTIIDYYPHLHDLVIWNPVLLHEFTTTQVHWFTSYLDHIYRYPHNYNSFIRNERMVAAFASTYREYTAHFRLCRYLEEKYDPDPERIAALRKTCGQDKDTIYDLLRSLKPYVADNKAETTPSMPTPTPAVVSNPDVAPAHLQATVAVVKKNKAPSIRPTKENRPLPPPPTPIAVPLEAPAKAKSPLPLAPVQEANTTKVLTFSTLRAQFVTCSSNNPLHVAVQAGELELVHFFMKNKSLQVANKIGDFPIHIAVKTGGVDIVRLLATDSNNSSVTNREGQTALALARSAGQHEIVKLLGGSDSCLDDKSQATLVL